MGLIKFAKQNNRSGVSQELRNKYENFMRDLHDQEGIETIFVAMKHKNGQDGLGTIVGNNSDLASTIAGLLQQGQTDSKDRKEFGLMLLHSLGIYYTSIGRKDTAGKIAELLLDEFREN